MRYFRIRHCRGLTPGREGHVRLGEAGLSASSAGQPESALTETSRTRSATSAIRRFQSFARWRRTSLGRFLPVCKRTSRLAVTGMVNAREDDRPRRPSPGRSSRAAADRAPSSFGSPCRARPRGLFAWPLPARRVASERLCGLDALSRRARSRHVCVGELPSRPRRHGRVSAPRRRRWPA
jgi:hypothetical protein